MSQFEKLLDRFLSIPADFSWEELARLLDGYGFTEKPGSGSRRCFYSDSGVKLFLHKPHPENIVKRYALRQVRDKLIELALIKPSK